MGPFGFPTFNFRFPTNLNFYLYFNFDLVTARAAGLAAEAARRIPCICGVIAGRRQVEVEVR